MEIELCFLYSVLSFLLSLPCFLSSAYGDISELTLSTSTVTYLPGFEGPLPFHLETGYVGVGASSQHQLFYYFVPSENNPGEDPLVLWLTGGRSCSVFSGLAFEIGPFRFKNLKFNGVGIPPLELNPHSWTKVASVIFLDQPVGTGFSYIEGRRDDQPRQGIDSIKETLEFLRKWLIGHPQFISNPLYLGGDSYAGKLVPVLAFHIATGIDNKEEPEINLQGYVIGNPSMDDETDYDSRVPFAHGMGLISEELYMSLKKNCKGAYTVAPDRDCKNDLDFFEKLLSKINRAHILESHCSYLSPKPYKLLRNRCLEVTNRRSHFLPVDLPTYGCRTYIYLLAYYWANKESVRTALGIRKSSVGEWVRCVPDLAEDVGSSISFHRNLSARGYRALVYSGDHDYIIPHIGTQAWIKSLNYSIVDEWRPWFLDNQVAGYTRTYSNKMTFATVKGGGHTAPEYKPVECFAMIRRWISHSPL